MREHAPAAGRAGFDLLAEGRDPVGGGPGHQRKVAAVRLHTSCVQIANILRRQQPFCDKLKGSEPFDSNALARLAMSLVCGVLGFGSTRSQVRILSPRLVTVRVLGETGDPCFLTCKRKCKRNSPGAGLPRVLGRSAEHVGGRWARKPVIDLPEAARDFLLHFLQLVAQEADASDAEQRRPPSGGDAGCHAAQGRASRLRRPLRSHESDLPSPPPGWVCSGHGCRAALPRLRCRHLRGRQVIVRGPDGQGLPRATARLSIRLEPQAGRKDGQLAVTESRPVRMSQNPSDPSNRSGSAVPEVHLYW
jgi:hypothetical protein